MPSEGKRERPELWVLKDKYRLGKIDRVVLGLILTKVLLSDL